MLQLTKQSYCHLYTYMWMHTDTWSCCNVLKLRIPLRFSHVSHMHTHAHTHMHAHVHTHTYTNISYISTLCTCTRTTPIVYHHTWNTFLFCSLLNHRALIPGSSHGGTRSNSSEEKISVSACCRARYNTVFSYNSTLARTKVGFYNCSACQTARKERALTAYVWLSPLHLARSNLCCQRTTPRTVYYMQT